MVHRPPVSMLLASQVTTWTAFWSSDPYSAIAVIHRFKYPIQYLGLVWLQLPAPFQPLSFCQDSPCWPIAYKPLPTPLSLSAKPDPAHASPCSRQWIFFILPYIHPTWTRDLLWNSKLRPGCTSLTPIHHPSYPPDFIPSKSYPPLGPTLFTYPVFFLNLFCSYKT